MGKWVVGVNVCQRVYTSVYSRKALLATSGAANADLSALAMSWSGEEDGGEGFKIRVSNFADTR